MSSAGRSITEKLRSDHIDLLQRLHSLERENISLKSRLNGVKQETVDSYDTEEHVSVSVSAKSLEEDKRAHVIREKDDLITSLKSEIGKLQAECKTTRSSCKIKLSKFFKQFEVNLPVIICLVF